MAERPGKKNHSENDLWRIGISAKEMRKLRARREKHRGVWFGLGVFGLVGWSVVIPTLAGIALGLWIDAETDSPYSWTLMLLFIGLVLGCLNAWYWIKQESRHD